LRTNRIAIVAAVLAIGALVALSATLHLLGLSGSSPSPAHPNWIEVQWPFPTDQWGKGRAFRCDPVDCGTLVDLYVRPKLGSCNCATGVGSDEDLDRMSDFDILGGEISPLTKGRPVTAGWMKGRSRTYAFTAHSGRSAISVVLNDRCDMIVASVVLLAGLPSALEPRVIEFLNSKAMLHWAEIELGI
jgi:hypothetical protein